MIFNLLDSKINSILQLSLDESILDSVQSIIQNMISTGEMLPNDSNSQQLSYLQSCGFGGLWRFAQPFAIGREKPENVELFIDCLEAMVETCLPPDNDSSFVDLTSNGGGGSGTSGGMGGSQSATASLSSQTTMTAQSIASEILMRNRHSQSNLAAQTASFLHLSSSTNLITGSMSSISMGSIHSPTDIDLFDLNESNCGLSRGSRNARIRRNSSPKNLM